MRKPKLRKTYFLLSIIIAGIIAGSCNKDDKGDLPQIVTNEVKSIMDISASVGGKVISNGGGKIIALGLCYSKENPNPTVDDEYTNFGTYTKDGIIESEWDFTLSLKNLTPVTKYYVRAYVANEAGLSYGEVKEFKTKPGKTFHKLLPSMIETFTQETTEGPKENLIDDKLSTYWHSAWSAGVAPLPHYIQITFDSPKGIGGFQYWFRGASARGGDPTRFDLQTSSDGVNYTTVWTSVPNLPANLFPPNGYDISLDKNYEAKYFRIRIIANRSNATYTTLSEFKVYHNGLLE